MATGDLIDWANIRQGRTSSSSIGSYDSGVKTSGSATVYVASAVFRVRSYAKKGALLAVAHCYATIYARRNNEWVQIGTCNASRGTGDGSSSSTNKYWGYNFDNSLNTNYPTSVTGTDSIFKVTGDFSANGSGSGRGGELYVYTDGLWSTTEAIYNANFKNNPIRYTPSVVGTLSQLGYSSEADFIAHVKSSAYSGNQIMSSNVDNLCTN